MKKFWKYISVCLAVVAAGSFLAACDDDNDLGPQEKYDYNANYVYLVQVGEPYAKIEYKANGQFLTDIDSPCRLVPVRCTKPAPGDLTFDVEINPDLVAEYNQANGTDYHFLEGCSLEKTTFLIKNGEFVSTDSIVVDFGDKSAFQSGYSNLMLPIEVKNAPGGTTLSKSSRLFLTFTSDYRANIVTPKNVVNMIDADDTGWDTQYRTQDITDFITTSWAADAPITVDLAVDNSVIDTYNALNGTNYKPLQATLSTNTINLAVGESAADLTLTVGDYSGIAHEEEYIVPIKVTVSGEGAQLAAGNEYVYVTYQYPRPAFTVSSSVASNLTQIPMESTWSAKRIRPTDDGPKTLNCSSLLDNTGYCDFSPGDSIYVDLGAVYPVRAIAIQYYAWYYAVEDYPLVQISADGTNWTDMPIQNPEDFFEYSQLNVLNFSKTNEMRYFRMVAGKPSYNADYGTFANYIYFYKR